jgi:microcin C transport system substrate-binding protein
LALAFDFQWENRALYAGFYTRDNSYFANSAMASSGAPSPDELKLLAPYRAQLPPALFAPFALPVTDGSGYNLPELAAALKLLTAAGWRVKNFALVSPSGSPMQFEILLDDPKYLKIVIPYAHDLSLLGINVSIRMLDPSAYLKREQNFAFDMTPATFPVSAEPGTEQAAYWGCAAARTPGSANLAGACSPAIDAMIAAELSAPDDAAKQTALHALDRLLLQNWFVVPLFYADHERLAWWQTKLARPDIPLQIGNDFSTWWAK